MVGVKCWGLMVVVVVLEWMPILGFVHALGVVADGGVLRDLHYCCNCLLFVLNVVVTIWHQLLTFRVKIVYFLRFYVPPGTSVKLASQIQWWSFNAPRCACDNAG